MMSDRDADGTPRRDLYIHQLLDRQVTEMLGMAKGVLCDGVINDAEILAFRHWLKMNADVAVTYPGNVLAQRLLTMLADGVIDEAERQEFRDFLSDLAGEPLGADEQRPSQLPLDRPPPTLFFDGKSYVFTGKFAAGSRDWCQLQVADRGGRCEKAVTGKTDVLVVGMIASPAWVQSSHGRKIEAAVAQRAAGRSIAIVGEEHWLSAIEYDAH